MKFLSKIEFLNKTLYLFAFFFLIFFSSCINQKHLIEKKSNIFDFTKVSFDNNSIYNLQGQWAFYWDTLLTPTQIRTTHIKKHMVEVPNLWTRYKINGHYLPSFGKATYQIKLIVPHKNFFSLKINRIFLAYKLFINDSLVLNVGEVSANKKNFKPDRSVKEVVFYSKKDTITLTFQVANFAHKKAGFQRNIKFGTPTAITKYTYTNLLYDMFIIGSLGFMMIFFFVLYFYNKENKSNLYFTFFLFIEILIVSLDRELLFFRIFPNVKWAIGLKIYYLASFLRPYLFIMLIDSFVYNRINKTFKRIILWSSLAGFVFVLFTPMHIYSYSLAFMILIILVTLVYETYITARFIRIDKKISFAFIGLVIILASAINDALFEYGIIKTFYSSGLGLFIFVLLQSIFISIKNANLLNREDFLKNKEIIQNRLRIALLSKPSYDLPGTLLALNKELAIDKTIIFTINKETDDVILSIIVEKSKVKENVNEIITLGKEHYLYDAQIVKYSFDFKENATSETFKPSKAYLHKYQVKSIITLPLVKNGKVIALIYFENSSRKMTKALFEVLNSAQTQFFSLINTAVTYFNLVKLNKKLDEEVKERTQEVEKQKQELDIQNQQLDEKVQLLEEQYAIQNELNHSLSSHIDEIEQENRILEEQNMMIIEQKNEIETNAKLINQNIFYANKILKAITKNEDKTPFEEDFHIDIPRNIVSGDFFWTKWIDDNFIFILADATGHGVPGALMRIFVNRKLQKIISNFSQKKLELLPNLILDELRNQIIAEFAFDKKQLSEGIDAILCVYKIKTSELLFSGAYNPLILIRNSEVKIYKGDRMPVGKYIDKFIKPFSLQKIKLDKNDLIYLITDGFIDQFGEEKNQKFYLANFKRLLFDIRNKPLNIQKQILIEEFYKWKGNFFQIDDVSIFGAKI
jgi:serine phosphatase RsbU (regulator of sigma subunit)